MAGSLRYRNQYSRYVDAITLTQGMNVKIESTYNDDKSRVNYKISVDDSAIKDAIQPELDQKADRDGSNLTETDIKGWKDTLGVSNLNSDVSNLQDQVTGLDNRVSSLNDRVDKVGAGAAALAGLHPLEFNPEDKFSASAALGNYKGDNAVASAPSIAPMPIRCSASARRSAMKRCSTSAFPSNSATKATASIARVRPSMSAL